MNHSKPDTERGHKSEETGRTEGRGREERGGLLGRSKMGARGSGDVGSQLLVSDLGFESLLFGVMCSGQGS